jgi:2-methylisocitrate lyase-like PEP mutase family enzyme
MPPFCAGHASAVTEETLSYGVPVTDFRALHVPGDPLVLPNAWDVASAAALAAAGFPAIGTTSLGVAAAHGLPDGRGAGREETLALVRRLGRLPVLLTVDVEGGFGGGPAAVAELAAELAAAGAVGINLEDGRSGDRLPPAESHSGDGLAPVDGRGGDRLVAVAEQAELIAAVKERVPGLFVNARTDTHWLGTGDVDEAVTRGRAYIEAGADGVFVPGLAGDEDVRVVVGAVGVPVNVLLMPGMTVPRLAALGVGRVSTGSMLFRAALGAAVAAARAVARGEPGPVGLPGYAEVDALAAGLE